ncbi:MAG: secondary thiamine-phosphate synthase enzyme YjbQ [Desulfosalsimonadaceae bacterium]
MKISVKSRQKTELIDITREVQGAVSSGGVQKGFCFLFVPHTTAAVTINESADPAVAKDILKVLNQAVPWQADYAHLEGNSPAHIKSSLVGSSQWLTIENGRLVLGTWQGVFFCEFDGPRNRSLYIRLLADNNDHRAG